MQPLEEMLVKCRRKLTTDKRKNLNASSGWRDYEVCKSMKLQYSTEIVIRKCNEMSSYKSNYELFIHVDYANLFVSVYSVSTFDLKLEDFGDLGR